MNLAVLALNVYVPLRYRRRQLNALIRETASAFGMPAPDLKPLSYAQCLEEYALFTKKAVEARLQSGDDVQTLRDALYRYAYGLGRGLREQLRLRSNDDVRSAWKALYRALGIELESDHNGCVIIHSCLFSRFYSPDVCRVMSSLDEGVAAGLSGGGKLSFSERITEGAPSCRAFLDFGGGAI